MEIPAEVQLVIEREVEKAKSEARQEAEKARNQAIGMLAFIALFLTIASGLGVSQMIKTYSSSAAEQAVKISMGKEFSARAERAALETENYSSRAKRSMNEIAEINQEAIGRLDQIKGAAGSIGAFRVASGRTNSSDWRANEEGITVLVDTSSGGFSETPIYLATLMGSGEHAWAVTGVTSIYGATPSRFKVFIRLPLGLLSPEEAKKQRWSIQWVGLEPVTLKARTKLAKP